MPLRVLIVDDHESVRRGIRALLAGRDDLCVCGEAADGVQAVEIARQLRPDVVLMDLSMPRMNGAEATRIIRREVPEAEVIVVSQNDPDVARRQTEEIGARGYVAKTHLGRDLLPAILGTQRGANGGAAADGELTRVRREAAATEHRLHAELELERDRIRNLFVRAPAPLCLLSGPEHRFTFANLEFLKVSGRHRIEDLLGKTIREALPEMAEQGFADLLDQVYRTGTPRSGNETKAIFRPPEGPAREQYLNILFQPIRDLEGNVEGILAQGVEVTEQVLARQAAQEGEERLRLAQTAAHIGTWEWDAAEDTRTLSPELYAIFGTDPNDPHHGEQWAANLYPEDRDKVFRLMREGYESGEMEFEYRYQHPELGLRWLYCKGRRIRKEPRMLGVVLDVTERKELEERLRNNEQRLRAIVETTPECVKLVAADGTLLHMNAAGLQMVGADSAEMVVGHCVYDLIAPEDRERFRDFNERICRGEKGSLEFDIITLGGRRRHMETHAAPLPQADGGFIQLGVTRDVTERAQAERANALLAAIVDSSDDAIISKNLDGFITSWNKGAERIFGFRAEEAIGRHITLIVPPDRHREEDEILARLREGERIEHFETVRRRKDGKLLDVSLTISPIRDVTGRIAGISKVSRDITESKAIARRQHVLFRLAAELNRTLSLQEIHAAALEAICSGIGSDRASILLVDESKVMRFVSWRGLSEGYRKAVDGHSPWKADAKDPQPVCISDVDTADLDDSLRAIVKAEGIRALFFVPLAVNGNLIGKFMTYFAEPHSFTAGELDLSLTIARQLAFAIERKKSEEALRESEARFRGLSERLESEVLARTRELETRNIEVLLQSNQLRELSWRLLRTQDEERRHIARELHDSAGQLLAVLSMSLTTLEETAKEKAPDLVQSVAQADRLLQQLTREIRTTSYLLHPPLLDEVGLSGALSWYIDGLRQRSGLKVDFQMPEDFGRLPGDMELVVFRLVQECLTNIHRHSGSKTAAIRIRRKPDEISVRVHDQGKGMPPEKLAEIQSRGSGVGIRGMRERLRQFRGEMRIESSAAGTTILVSIPVGDEPATTDGPVGQTTVPGAISHSGAPALSGHVPGSTDAD